MHLIIGGAYQGKRAFAETRFQLKPGDIFSCTGEDPDFSYKCLDRLEEFTLSCVKAGRDSVTFFRENRAHWEGSVLILRDISGYCITLSELFACAALAAGQILN